MRGKLLLHAGREVRAAPIGVDQEPGCGPLVRRARWGSTTYFGSFVEATPASNTPKRCRTLPTSRATPDTIATPR